MPGKINSYRKGSFSGLSLINQDSPSGNALFDRCQNILFILTVRFF